MGTYRPFDQCITDPYSALVLPAKYNAPDRLGPPESGPSLDKRHLSVAAEACQVPAQPGPRRFVVSGIPLAFRKVVEILAG